jgi:hypothetical protein
VRISVHHSNGPAWKPAHAQSDDTWVLQDGQSCRRDCREIRRNKQRRPAPVCQSRSSRNVYMTHLAAAQKAKCVCCSAVVKPELPTSRRSMSFQPPGPPKPTMGTTWLWHTGSASLSTPVKRSNPLDDTNNCVPGRVDVISVQPFNPRAALCPKGTLTTYATNSQQQSPASARGLVHPTRTRCTRSGGRLRRARRASQ